MTAVHFNLCVVDGYASAELVLSQEEATVKSNGDISTILWPFFLVWPCSLLLEVKS